MLNSLAGAFRKLFSRKHRAALEKHSQGAGENISEPAKRKNALIETIEYEHVTKEGHRVWLTCKYLFGRYLIYFGKRWISD